MHRWRAHWDEDDRRFSGSTCKVSLAASTSSQDWKSYSSVGTSPSVMVEAIPDIESNLDYGYEVWGERLHLCIIVESEVWY